MKKNQYYKVANEKGWDFHTGNTINYRKNIGETVKVPTHTNRDYRLCSNTVLHASKNVHDALSYAKIPCSIYVVKGNPVIEGNDKFGFTEFEVVKEIPQNQFDDLLGFRYQEAINPFDPRAIKNPKVTDIDLKNLKTWTSVRDSAWISVMDSVRASVRIPVMDSVWTSVRTSVWDSVWDSVMASVRIPVRDSVWTSVRDSVWTSVMDSVRTSVMDSVWDSEYAYIGTLFPKIKKWKYTNKLNIKGYPFQSSVELTKRGLIPVYYEDKWHLFTAKGILVWEGIV